MGQKLSKETDKKIPEGSTHVLSVKTGDIKYAGTDANVKVILYNEKGEKSDEFKLDARWRNDFERGRTDHFYVKCDGDFRRVDKLEMWRDAHGIFDNWFVDFVKVKNISSEIETLFPLHRWLPANRRIRVKEFDCLLPQEDDDFERRKDEIEEKKKKYLIDVKVPGLLPQVKSLPDNEAISHQYASDMYGLKNKLLLRMIVKKFTTREWKQPEDILPVYSDLLAKPSGFSTWQCDFAFGRQRLAHCNPTWIRRCEKVPDQLAVTDEMLKPFMEGLSIEQAIMKKKLFIVDYSFLEGVECNEGRSIPAPYALFFVTSFKTFRPIAIQLYPEPSENNPVFLPTDHHITWQLAKMWFNLADSSVHQSSTHLGFTHLLMEAICIATNRSLSPSHPIYRLLAPHFLYLMAVNSAAVAELINEGGIIDTMNTMGRIGLFNTIKRVLLNWRLDVQGTLPNDLKERGVEDPEVLPNYHYRDDGMLLYNVLSKYASTVIKGHYDNPEKVKGDVELQEWARSLTAPTENDGVGIPGVPGDGKFDNVDDLIAAVVPIIFISSVGHAAVNFPQYDDYGFPPNYPAFLNGTPPTDKKPRTEKDLFDAIPSKKIVLYSLIIFRVLSERATNPLGNFEVQYQYDPIGTKAVKDLIEDLKHAGEVIDERNEERTYPYYYLHPKEIPNAINA